MDLYLPYREPSVKATLGFNLKKLPHLLPAGPTRSALAGHALHVVYPELSAADAAALTRASTAYLTKAWRLTPDERGVVARGEMKLYRTGRREFNLVDLIPAASDPSLMTDTELDQHVNKIGIERVMAALDRVTAPTKELMD